jgi:hypothetical protein
VTRPPRPPHRVFWPFTHATAQKGTPASPIHTVTLAHVETLPPPGQCCGACQRCVRALACDGARSNTNSPLGARKSTERPDISHSCLQPHHCALRLPRPSSHTHTQHMGNCDFSCVPCHAAPHFQAHTPCRPRHGSPLTFFSPIFLISTQVWHSQLQPPPPSSPPTRGRDADLRGDSSSSTGLILINDYYISKSSYTDHRSVPAGHRHRHRYRTFTDVCLNLKSKKTGQNTRVTTTVYTLHCTEYCTTQPLTPRRVHAAMAFGTIFAS